VRDANRFLHSTEAMNLDTAELRRRLEVLGISIMPNPIDYKTYEMSLVMENNVIKVKSTDFPDGTVLIRHNEVVYIKLKNETPYYVMIMQDDGSYVWNRLGTGDTATLTPRVPSYYGIQRYENNQLLDPEAYLTFRRAN
jgi:hypothetical protein